MIHPNSEIQEFDITIIGSTGNLSLTKILPALLKRYVDGQIPPNSKIFCLARQKLNDSEFIDLLKSNIPKNTGGSSSLIKKFLSKIKYHCIDITNPDKENLLSFQKCLIIFALSLLDLHEPVLVIRFSLIGSDYA